MNKPEKPPSPSSGMLSTLLGRWLPSSRAESKADVLENLKLAEHDGIVARDAYDMMQRVLMVSDLKVRDIMIPRTSMIHVDKDDDLDRCLDIMVESAHSIKLLASCSLKIYFAILMTIISSVLTYEI